MKLNLTNEIAIGHCPVCERRQYVPPMAQMDARCVRCLFRDAAPAGGA